MINLVPPYTPEIITEPNLIDATSQIVDLETLPIRLSVNTIIAASSESAVDFKDGTLATGTYSITSFAAMHFTAATPSGTITYGTPSNGDTIVFTGLPTDGTKTFTKAASAGANQFSTITELTALIQALTDLNATDNGTIVTITVATKGSAMNSATVTGTGSYSGLSITFSGGIDAAIVTVAGHALTESTDFNAVTSNNQTATNLAAAIDALSEVQSTASTSTVNVKAATVGTTGNSITTTKTGSGITVAQALLSGGTNSSINGTTHRITATAHGYETGLKVQFAVLSGTAPTPLVNTTYYYIIVVDANTIKLADSEAHAIAGTALAVADANDAIGGGEFTLTPLSTINAVLAISGSNDGVNFVQLDTDTFSAAGASFHQYPTVSFRFLEVAVDPNAVETNVRVIIHSKL